MELRPTYLIQYEDIKHLVTIDSFFKLVELVENTPGIKLSNLKAMDLVFCNGEPIRYGNGVYIFKSDERNYYVGNCVARNFTERIPAHFDIRKVGWFNSLLKAIAKYHNDEINNENLIKAAKFANDNLSLVLINFEIYNRDIINNLETLLGRSINPINKNFKKVKVIEGIVTDVI